MGEHDTTLTDTDLMTDSVESDRVLRAMADERRRAALTHLAEADGPVSVDELAGRLADGIGPRDEATGDRHERVATELVHCHLPVLEYASLVTYDPETNLAETDVEADAVEEVLSLLPP